MKSTTSSTSLSQTQSSTNMSMYKQGQQTPLTIDEVKPIDAAAIRRRRQNFQGMATFYVPLLADTINRFFQATTTMEEEILLPSRLKDLPLEELIFDTSVQPDNWHELYSFLREIRNQLTERSIFSELPKQQEPPAQAKPQPESPVAAAKQDQVEEEEEEEEKKRERPVFVAAEDSQASCSGSIISSVESEQSASSTDSTSYQTIKDEIKYHYHGFLASLSSLASIAERVTEKYREKYDF